MIFMILEQITQEVSNRPLPEIELVNDGNCCPNSCRSLNSKGLRSVPKLRSFTKSVISSVSGSKEEKLEERKIIGDFKRDEGEKDHFSENLILLSSLDAPKVDYGKLFSYLENKRPQEEVYGLELEKAEGKREEEESAVMGNEKAGEMVQKYLMAAIFGNKEDINYQENEKFVWWLKNNPDLLSLYEKLSVVKTNNVNYGKIN